MDRCKLHVRVATASVLDAIGCYAHTGTQLASAWEAAGTLPCCSLTRWQEAEAVHAWLFFSEPLEALQLPSKVHLYKVSRLLKPLKSSANTFTNAHQGLEEVSTGNTSHSNYSTRRR